MLGWAKRYNLWFKAIAFFIVQAFLLIDIALAGGGDLRWLKQPEVSCLAPVFTIGEDNFFAKFDLIVSLVNAFEQKRQGLKSIEQLRGR